jgi:hypothetical protein
MHVRALSLVALAATAMGACLAGCGGDMGSPDLGETCRLDTDCADEVFCNGQEMCSPSHADADDRGCLSSTSPACGTGFLCDEGAATCTIDCSTPDPDGDGHDSVLCGGDDCDDQDADRFPGNVETCVDGEGGMHDEDCNPDTFGALDADGDGEIAAECCNADGLEMNCGPDCDDGNRARRAGQLEICDAVDNDCDDAVDEATQSVDWYVDADGDGFGAPGLAVHSCIPIVGRSLLSSDCDDMNSARNPGQTEICDLAENNCNGLTDEQPYCDAIVVVGPAGGTLMTTSSSGGAVAVSVPAGALATAVPLSIGEFHPRSLPALVNGQRFIGLPIAFTPFGTAFAQQVTISLPATDEDVIVLALSGPDDPTWERVGASIGGGLATFTVRAGGIFVVATRTCLGQACCPGQCPSDMGVPPSDMGVLPSDMGQCRRATSAQMPTDMGQMPGDAGDMGAESMYVVIDETFDGASLPSMFEHWTSVCESIRVGRSCSRAAEPTVSFDTQFVMTRRHLRVAWRDLRYEP